MRKYFVILGGLLALLVAPRPAAAAVCPTATFAFYLTNYSGATGCTIGDKEFQGFTLVNSGDQPLTASQITISPISAGDLGFTFAAGWSVPPGTVLDSLIGYTVIAQSATIHDLFLSCNCAATAGSVASVTESYRTGTGATGTLLVSSVTGVLSTEVVFATPTTSVTVTKDILVRRLDTAGSTATISSVVNQFSQIPEPATLTLFGLGLSGAAALRRRSMKRHAAR